jgi:eukaryotic-like serine/threonine-protein kinase
MDAEPSVTNSEASTQQRIEARVRSRLFAAEPVAARIGRYLVLESIGRGGMGMVYAAYDDQLDRKVAIKVLLDDELPGEDDRRRFLREARALARLSHPHVVTVHEVGESDGQVFLAMEFVRGQSLSEWLRTKPDWPQVLGAFVQAGQGLMAAHEAGLIHRDLKPANIMRGEDGVVKVLDFGVAQMVAQTLGDSGDRAPAAGSAGFEPSLVTRTGAMMGTPAYMAPEQLMDGQVDARSDQYGFCVSLWEGLTGQRPFSGSSLDAMVAVRLDGPPAWPDEAPPVPRSIVEALRRGLSPLPEQRWPSMQALLEGLTWEPKHRRSRWLVGLAAVGVLAASGVTAGAWLRARAERCSGATEQLAEIWDDARRQEVEAALVGVDVPYARAVSAWTQRALTTYADAWVTMQVEACEATTVRGEQSPHTLELRTSCLQRAAEDLRATVDTLADADAELVSNAHALVAGLRPLSRCESTTALESEGEPPQPDEVDEVVQARRQLARARSLRAAGRFDTALEVTTPVVRALEGVEYGPVRAELMLERGHVLAELGQYEAAQEALSDALHHGSQWDQRAVMADASITLMHVSGLRLRKIEAALLLAPLVKGLVDGNPRLEADSREVLGGVHMLAERFEQAEAEYRAVLALREQFLSSDDPQLASTHGELGAALQEQGKLGQAKLELEAALESSQQTLGPEHPATRALWNRLDELVRASRPHG